MDENNSFVEYVNNSLNENNYFVGYTNNYFVEYINNSLNLNNCFVEGIELFWWILQQLINHKFLGALQGVMKAFWTQPFLAESWNEWLNNLP